MDEEENAETKLIGDLSQDNVSTLFPRFILSQNNLYSIISDIKTVTWEKEGLHLLEKRLFNDNDIKTAKKLIIKGVPDKYRGEFWFIASGAKIEMEEHPNYYSFLLNGYPSEIELPNEKQIDLDINRTFPDDPFFAHNITVLKSLRNILLAYSKRNLSIGYVQGFNFIAGRLLKYIDDEEKVFWTFSQIIEYILPINYYSEMAGVMVDVDILICLMNQKYVPDLEMQMKEGFFIYLKNILFQWFLSLFILNLSEESSLALWDCFFLDKSVVLFKAALSLIKMKKNDLLKANDLENLRGVIMNSFTKFDNVNYLKVNMLLKRFEFDQAFLDINRNEIEREIINKINSINEQKIDKLKEKTKSRIDTCNLAWPYCIYDCNSYYSVVNQLIMQSEKMPEIINNYVEQSDDTSDNDTTAESNQVINYSDALIERKCHVCQGKGHFQYHSLHSSSKKEEEEKIKMKATYTPRKQKTKTKNDEEAYLDLKNKYRKLRTNQKCISSVTFGKEVSKKENKVKNYEAFVSKINFTYNLVSYANNYHLKETKDNNQSRGLSMNNVGTNFL